MPFSGEQAQILLGVARSAIRSMLAGAMPPPPASPDGSSELAQPAGCFVSLHHLETRRLRGCVGRLESRESLIMTMHESAINVLSDPRFVHDPITLDELPKLELELTILSPLKAAASCFEFEPIVHGIFLTIEERGGCFLPQVARDTGWSREKLLDRLCTEKLSLAADSWRKPPARLYTFTAEIIGPQPFVEGLAT